MSREKDVINEERVTDRTIGIIAQVQDYEVFSISGLQLYEWHSTKAVNKKLVNECYDKKERKTYSNLILSLIQSATFEKIEKNCRNLLKQFRIKDQITFLIITTYRNINLCWFTVRK